MNRIWANRLEAGTQVWTDCPASRREAVRALLYQDVEIGKISQERLQQILGEEYEGE